MNENIIQWLESELQAIQESDFSTREDSDCGFELLARLRSGRSQLTTSRRIPMTKKTPPRLLISEDAERRAVECIEAGDLAKAQSIILEELETWFGEHTLHPTARRCLRCGQTVYTSAPTILCDGIISKVVPLSKHEQVPVIGADE